MALWVRAGPSGVGRAGTLGETICIACVAITEKYGICLREKQGRLNQDSSGGHFAQFRVRSAYGCSVYAAVVVEPK